MFWHFDITIKVVIHLSSGDKDDDDDDDADDKIQSSVLTVGEEGRQGSQEQSEVDHGDFEMVVSKVLVFCQLTLLRPEPENSGWSIGLPAV